jgi:hypothetical protein
MHSAHRNASCIKVEVGGGSERGYEKLLSCSFDKNHGLSEEQFGTRDIDVPLEIGSLDVR